MKGSEYSLFIFRFRNQKKSKEINNPALTNGRWRYIGGIQMNLKDYQKGRNDGLALAAKIINEGGIDALQEEIKARKAYGVNTNLTMKELDDAALPIKQQIFKSMLVMALHTLEDEFDFGNVRLMRFMDRFETKTSCLAGSWVNWFEIVNDFEQRRKIKLKMPLEMD